MPLYLGETQIEGLMVKGEGGGGSPVIEELDVAAAGTYAAGSGVDGYSPVVVPAGTAGTPTASKGNVSNNSVQVTPSVTNSAGFIAGGTKNGTPVTVQASELVSGTKNITEAGETDVTNYQKASVAAGSEGTPTASKGTVSNNSVAVTPSVTNTAGLISGGTKSGTPVTVSASELVSGKKEITSNGDDIDVTNFEKVKVAVPTGGSDKNIQYVMGSASVRTNGYTSTGMSITVKKTGTYKVSWVGWRSSSSGTMGTNLYKNDTAGTNQQTFTSTYGQCITLNNQSYNAGDVLTLYATAGSTTRYMYVANLIIEEQ